jgi:hypothetical protein
VAISHAVATDSAASEAAVEEADGLLARFTGAGVAAARRFVDEGHLEHVLALYGRAMRKEPEEASYPWNLASSLDRLGLSDFALPFIGRAVRTAQAHGDEQFGGAAGHVAWAEVAINADQPELAAALLQQARSIDPSIAVERYERELRRAANPMPSVKTANKDSARKGAAVEHLIAAHCMLASDFELNVSTSLVDDEGVDLVFHRRGHVATLAVQVKSRSWTASTMQRNEAFVAQVRNETFARRRDLYMLFVAVDPQFGEYGPVWLIPSREFASAIKPNQRNRLRFAASANPASRDRWSKYRLERSQLPRTILDELATLERTTA